MFTIDNGHEISFTRQVFHDREPGETTMYKEETRKGPRVDTASIGSSMEFGDAEPLGRLGPQPFASPKRVTGKTASETRVCGMANAYASQ